MVDHPFEIAILGYAPCSDQPIWNIDFLNPLIAPALAKVGACGSCGSCGSQTCTEYRNSDLGGESDRERESVESAESVESLFLLVQFWFLLPKSPTVWVWNGWII